MTQQTVEVALNFAFEKPADVPDWIELLPAGPVITGRDGRSWRLDDPQAIVDAFAADGVDLPVDLEHATEIKGPKGEAAPAVGWVKQLEVRNGAIYGRIEWTNEGKMRIAEREYRYTSPVFLARRGTGQITRLSSVGLVNKPNLHIKALNRQQPEEEEIMLKKLLAKLGLPESAGEEEALNAVERLQSDLQTARNRAETPPLDKFVPRADFDQALERAANAEKRLNQMEQEQLEAQINAAIDQALKAGKITPATKGFYAAMCRSEGGLEQFKKFVEAAPTIGDVSNLDGKKPPEQQPQLNRETEQLAAVFGNSVEDLQKYGLA